MMFFHVRVCGVTARHIYRTSGGNYPLIARCIGCTKTTLINGSYDVASLERIIDHGEVLYAEPLTQ